MFGKYFIGKSHVSSIFLFFNTLVWYFMMQIMKDDILSDLNVLYEQTLMVGVVFYTSIMVSTIVGLFLSRKIQRFRFLYLWVILGATTSLLPTLFNDITITIALVISLFWGFSFGLGLPSCLAYFANCTLIENRGSISGMTFLLTNVSILPFGILFGMFNRVINSAIFGIWRGFGLLTFFSLKLGGEPIEMKKHASFVSVLHNKILFLYLAPWLMFTLIDAFGGLILERFLGPDLYLIMHMMELILISFSAFIAGLLCDWIGRKRVVMYGFIGLGLAYAVMSISPTLGFSQYFYFIIDGISWGIFFVTFILILWGDLSSTGAREEYYLMGSIPFFLAGLTRSLLAPYITWIPAYAAFSLASFFLFVAVLPLMYAPETLPEKKIELRRLKKYVEAARKIKEKYAEKSSKN